MLKTLLYLSLFVMPLLSNQNDNTPIQPRVINGSTVSDNNNLWRFIVALKNNGSQYCGGSIIKPNWVLTAAHCLSDDNGNLNPVYTDDSIGVGAYNLNDMTEYTVKRYIIHPDYNSGTLDNDIALVELHNSVNGITPIVYETSHLLIADTQTQLAGWGNMSASTNNYPDDLQEVLLPIVNFDICNSVNSYDNNLTSNMFCAGYLDGRSDGCQGDSGGPLIVNNTIVGVVSFGNGCALENFPGVYTKVQNYSTWIDKTTKVIVKPKPVKPSPWIPIHMGDITIFVPNPLYSK